MPVTSLAISPPRRRCAVCALRECSDKKSVTCSLVCRERLCIEGPADRSKCSYCHRQPKQKYKQVCSPGCTENARFACLLCKSQQIADDGDYLCGRNCKQIIANWPRYRILEAPPGHAIFGMVEERFKGAWKYSGTALRPDARKVFNVIRTERYLERFNEYKKRVGNVVLCYHGTTMRCRLGSSNQTDLCFDECCSLCSILRYSFRKDLSKSSTAFGRGIYTSSASNKAYNYADDGDGAIIVCSVALGEVRYVNKFKEVTSCPKGYNSVVYERGVKGSLNETVVYNDDAIRPLCVILF